MYCCCIVRCVLTTQNFTIHNTLLYNTYLLILPLPRRRNRFAADLLVLIKALVPMKHGFNGNIHEEDCEILNSFLIIIMVDEDDDDIDE